MGVKDGMTIELVLSVDWEGTTLLKPNLEAMAAFNQVYPHIPKVHFLNPGYHTRLPNHAPAQISAQIRAAMGPCDEIGLRLHPWKQLVEAFGVAYYPGPSYLVPGPSAPWLGLYGGDVPISAYDDHALTHLFEGSCQLLDAQGFGRPRYFRGGGWVSAWHVQQAAVAVGIRADSSPVPPELVARHYPNTLLAALARQHWGHITVHTLPYRLDLAGQMLDCYPNNLCLADYVDDRAAMALVRQIVRKARLARHNTVHLHYGWHQESATVAACRQPDGGFTHKPVRYLASVTRLMAWLPGYARQVGARLVFPRLCEATLAA